jgi:hypothetical protein
VGFATHSAQPPATSLARDAAAHLDQAVDGNTQTREASSEAEAAELPHEKTEKLDEGRILGSGAGE